MKVDVAIIGAGIIGLATALEIARSTPPARIVVLEKERDIATHQSGHNSGVIHSGIYYKPGTLKSRLCKAGAAEMLSFVRENGIPHQVCGKLIIATRPEQVHLLDGLFECGSAIGLEGLRKVGPTELTDIEPLSVGIRALHIPSAAVTDYRMVCEKIADMLRQREVAIVNGVEILHVKVSGASVHLLAREIEVEAGKVINCAGLQSDRVARLAGSKPPIRIVPFRGEYFEVAHKPAALVRGLIYPAPDPTLPFLGVHLTRQVNGRVSAGPNAVLALSREGYHRLSIRPTDLLELITSLSVWKMAARNWQVGVEEMYRSLSTRQFVESVQQLTPALRSEDLFRNGSGVRAQAIEKDGSFSDDFRFLRDGPVLHVLNVPSPAATAAFAIARVVASKAGINTGPS